MSFHFNKDEFSLGRIKKINKFQLCMCVNAILESRSCDTMVGRSPVHYFWVCSRMFY